MGLEKETQKYIQEDGRINWKKLKENAININSQNYAGIINLIFKHLESEGIITRFPTEEVIILFRPNEWDLNPFYKDSHWYFTEKGKEEARKYSKDFLKKPVALTKIIEWVIK